MSNAYTPARTPIRFAALAVSALLVAASASVLEGSSRNERFVPVAKATPINAGKTYARGTGWHDSLRVVSRAFGIR